MAGYQRLGVSSIELSAVHTGQELAQTLDICRRILRAGLHLTLHGTTENISEFENCRFAEEVLAAGVFCALKYPWNFTKGVLLAAYLGGSAGSVAGSIIGVINGRSGIPAHGISSLRERRIVSRIADDLWKRFEVDPEGHVTEKWWNAYPGF